MCSQVPLIEAESRFAEGLEDQEAALNFIDDVFNIDGK